MLARLLRLHPSTYKRSLSLERQTQNRLPANRAACFGSVFPKIKTAYKCSGAIAAVAQAWPLLPKRSMPHSPVYVPLILRGYIDDALIRMIEGQHRQQIVLDMRSEEHTSELQSRQYL